MELSKNAKTLLLLAGVIALVAAVYGIPVLLKGAEPQVCTVNGECQHEAFANQLITAMPVVLLAGVLVGAAAYYLVAERAQRMQPKIDLTPIYKLLDESERKVFQKLVDNGGKVSQSELSYLGGIGKVKAHRIIERMEKKGIIEKEGFGKTNMVKLSKDLGGLFSKQSP